MTYTPSLSYISGISNAVQATATFTMPHNFTPGENVAFRVTQPYGMTEINNMIGRVLALTSNTITVDINSTFWKAFIIPISTIGTSPPTCLPSSSGLIPNYPIPTINLLDAFDVNPGGI